MNSVVRVANPLNRETCDKRGTNLCWSATVSSLKTRALRCGFPILPHGSCCLCSLDPPPALEFQTFHAQFLTLCFRQQEREINVVEKEPISMVACVKEDRVRLPRLHCVMRLLHTHGLLHSECEPIVHEPTVTNEIPVSQSVCRCSLNATNFQQRSTKHSRDTLLLKVSNTNHTHCLWFLTCVITPSVAQSTASSSVVSSWADTFMIPFASTRSN